MKSIIFWDMTPCSPLSCVRRFGGTYRLHLQGRINRFSKPANKQAASTICHLLARWFVEPISSTLKMEAISSSETSDATQRTTRRHIPEDDTLDVRCSEESRTIISVLINIGMREIYIDKASLRK
jgi:hypothetical protein